MLESLPARFIPRSGKVTSIFSAQSIRQSMLNQCRPSKITCLEALTAGSAYLISGPEHFDIKTASKTILRYKPLPQSSAPHCTSNTCNGFPFTSLDACFSVQVGSKPSKRKTRKWTTVLQGKLDPDNSCEFF
jgi:hypothetical protein